MTTSEIVALISSIFTAISGISAVIVCFLTFRTTRPQIKLKTDKKPSNRAYAYWHNKSFAFLSLEIINSSNIAGMIDDLCIIYKGKEYPAENIYAKYDPHPFELKSFFDEQIEQDTQALHLKTPLKIDGYSIKSGFFLFPTFPVIQANEIVVTLRFRLINKKFKRKIRRVKFSCISPNPVHDSKN